MFHVSMPAMITDMDIIMTDAGQIVLVVPGVIPEGALLLGVQADAVTLAADDDVFVRVEDIDNIVLDTISALDHVDLIAVPEGAETPTGITHQAGVKDFRA